MRYSFMMLKSIRTRCVGVPFYEGIVRDVEVYLDEVRVSAFRIDTKNRLMEIPAESAAFYERIPLDVQVDSDKMRGSAFLGWNP